MDEQKVDICETLDREEAAGSSQDDTGNLVGIDPSGMAELESDKVKDSEDICGEQAAKSGPEETASSKDVHEQPSPQQESVVFYLDVNDHQDGTSRLSLETPEREEDGFTPGGGEEEEEEVKQTVPPEDQEDRTIYQEHLRIHQELSQVRDEAVARGAQLQSRLAEHFRKNTPDEGLAVLEQPEAYESHLHLLSEQRRQLGEASQAAQQQAEQLRLQCQEKQEKVHLTTLCLRCPEEC